MKVIGKTDHGVLLEASRDELARLVGYFSGFQMDRSGQRIGIGDEIQISKMYDQLYDIGRKTKELAEAAKLLRSAASLVEQAVEPIKDLRIEVER